MIGCGGVSKAGDVREGVSLGGRVLVGDLSTKLYICSVWTVEAWGLSGNGVVYENELEEYVMKITVRRNRES
jgi:hypothetical protein